MTADDPIPLRPVDAETIATLSFADIAHESPFCSAITISAALLSDVIAHVNNIEMVRLLDRAAELHADAGGFTRQRLLRDGVMWFVARHEINYEAEAFEGDRLVVATWVREVARVKAWRDSVIVRPADQTIVCRASTLWVLVDLDSRRPTRMTEAMIDHLRPLHRRPHQPTRESSCTSA